MADTDVQSRSGFTGFTGREAKGSAFDSEIDKMGTTSSRISAMNDTRGVLPDGMSPARGFGGMTRNHFVLDHKKVLCMSNLKEKLASAGNQLRQEITALMQKDLNPRSDAIDLMSAGKDRKNDTVYSEEKVIERIFTDDKLKEMGGIACIDVDSKREVLLLGTKKQHVVYYNFKQNAFKLLKLKVKGAITSIELGKTGEYAVAGTEGGAVFLLQIKSNMLDTIVKIEGFTKENIKNVRFVEPGLGIVVLDFAENLFYLNANMSKAKPTYDVQIIQSPAKGAKLSHLKIISVPRLDGNESKVKLLWVGGFKESLVFKMSKNSFIPLESLENIPSSILSDPTRSSRISSPGGMGIGMGSMLSEEEHHQAFCIEDYDVLPWISPSEVRILYVVRGSRICIRFAHLTNEDELMVNNFSEFVFPDTIIYACLICPGILCVVDSFNQIKFINMKRIIRSQREKKDIDFATANYVSLKSLQLKDVQLLYTEDQFGRGYKDYYPFMTPGRKGRFLLMLTTKKLVNFELMDWQTYVGVLEKELDYLSVIQLLIEISEGEYYKLYGISPVRDRRRELMTEFIEGFVGRLTEKKVVETSTSPNAMMRILTTLLVKTGNIDYLFNSFYEQMQAINLSEDMVHIIEDYIKAGTIGSFNPESLSGYIMEVLPETLKKKLLLECFNSATDKRGLVINMTIHNQYYDLLYYMCPKHDPISCLFPVSLGLVQLDMFAQDPVKREQVLFKIYWFCESLLKGTLMFGDKIEGDKARDIQMTIIKWIVDPMNAKPLAKVDLIYFLDLILISFNETNLIMYQEYIYNEPKNQQFYQFKILSEASLKDFDMLFSEVRLGLEPNQMPIFSLFLAILMLAGLPKVKLEGSTIEFIMTILVGDFDQLLKNNRIILKEEEMQALVFDIFTTNAALLKKSKDFTTATEKSQNVFRLMMLETQDKFEETFGVYIKLIRDKRSHSALFFQWLKRVFRERTDRRGASDLARILPENFAYLVEIGKSEAMSIWELFDGQLKIETAQALDKRPQDQLEFLRKLMKAAENKDSRLRVPDNIRLLYFTRICEFSKEEVLNELKKNNWPTLECLEICLRHNVELGVAYINERLGKYMEALEIYMQRFTRFANDFRAKISGRQETFFYEEVHNEDVKDGNLFKVHPRCSLAAKEFLDLLQEEHLMFKSLAKASDNKLELCYRWFSMLMKLKNARALNEQILMRFLIDTFDEITNNATVERILEDVNRDRSDIKLFDSKELSLRFINSCKRNITNWEMMSMSLLDDTIKLNDDVYESKIKSLPARDTVCDLSYIPLREGKQIAIFDNAHKYLVDNLTETHKGKYVDERTMKKSNLLTQFNAFSGDRWSGTRFKTVQDYRDEYYRNKGVEQMQPEEDYLINGEMDRLDEYDTLVRGVQEKEQKIVDNLVGFFVSTATKKKIQLPELNFDYFDIS